MKLRTGETTSVVIANGAALSSSIDMSGSSGLGIFMPAAWTAAEIAFQVSHDGTTYYPLHDSDDALVEETVTVDNAYSCSVDLFPFRYVKLWSESAGSDENQGAARTIIVVVKS